jgi:nitrogen fixation/metabolism regulation signal transduction histidine kinase
MSKEENVSPSMSPTASVRPKFKRSARNYLLDSRFQLKYTGYIVALTITVSLALGFLIYRQASKTVAIGNEAVAVGAEANKAGQEAVDQSNALNTKLEMDAMKGYGDDPGLIAIVKDANKAQTDAITARAKQLQDQKIKLENQRVALENQARTLMLTLGGLLTALVVLLGIGGIITTHKIVGPIFKMKRLLREVGDGNLTVQGHLRKGDELHEFFHVFTTMVEKLRHRQEREIKILDGAIELAEKSNADEALLTRMRALRADMHAALEVH